MECCQPKMPEPELEPDPEPDPGPEPGREAEPKAGVECEAALD